MMLLIAITGILIPLVFMVLDPTSYNILTVTITATIAFYTYRNISKDIESIVISMIIHGRRPLAFNMHPLVYYRVTKRKIFLIEDTKVDIDDSKFPLKTWCGRTHHIFKNDKSAVEFAMRYPSLTGNIGYISDWVLKNED